MKAFENGQLSSDFVKWAHGLATSIGSEGTNFGGNDPSIDTRMTPQEAKEKIDEIYANKDHAFHKGDPAAMKRMIELVTAANPNASRDVNDLRKGTSFGT